MRIWISIKSQLLELFDENNSIVSRYAISTAANGAGEQKGSYRTPRGRHLIRAKIGAGASDNTVFVRRRPTGEVWSPELAAANPGRDWILTRILWLSGLEPGLNRLGEVDTMRRYIYLHGSPDTVPMGSPGSIGCIRMRNRDIVELFERVPAYTPVDIVEYGIETGDWTMLGPEAGPVRETVFVHELGAPLATSCDQDDSLSLHVLARGPSGEAIGTGRLLPDGQVGRIAVMPQWRHKGVGTALICRLLEMARQREITNLALRAHTTATPFYRRFGFAEADAEFMEAGIPHVLMTRRLPA